MFLQRFSNFSWINVPLVEIVSKMETQSFSNKISESHVFFCILLTRSGSLHSTHIKMIWWHKGVYIPGRTLGLILETASHARIDFFHWVPYLFSILFYIYTFLSVFQIRYFLLVTGYFLIVFQSEIIVLLLYPSAIYLISSLFQILYFFFPRIIIWLFL